MLFWLEVKTKYLGVYNKYLNTLQKVIGNKNKDKQNMYTLNKNLFNSI